MAQLLTSKVPLRDPDGQICGVLGVDTDISALKAAQVELRHALDELELRVKARTTELASANDQLRREIAERVQAETALRISQERYRHVAELTSDFAYAFRVALDGSFEAEWITDAFARVVGRSPADLGPSGRLLDLVHTDGLLGRTEPAVSQSEDDPATRRCPNHDQHTAETTGGRVSCTDWKLGNRARCGGTGVGGKAEPRSASA